MSVKTWRPLAAPLLRLCCASATPAPRLRRGPAVPGHLSRAPAMLSPRPERGNGEECGGDCGQDGGNDMWHVA
eukprot:4461829-Lingulodinium_polyedra.AAC.1